MELRDKLLGVFPRIGRVTAFPTVVFRQTKPERVQLGLRAETIFRDRVFAAVANRQRRTPHNPRFELRRLARVPPFFRELADELLCSLFIAEPIF